MCEKAKRGPCRDPAIPIAGAAAIRPITDDDLEFDCDVPTVYDDAFDVFKGLSCDAVTKEEREGYLSEVPTNQNQGPSVHPTEDIPRYLYLTEGVEDNDGDNDKLSPITVREQRAAGARRIFGLKPFTDQHHMGDQTDQAAP